MSGAKRFTATTSTSRPVAPRKHPTLPLVGSGSEGLGSGNNFGRAVTVIGGGIGGLTAALAFARTGARVTVLEQAAALTEIGAGLQITPNGARVLDALGLSGALDSKGLRAQAVQPLDALSGRSVAQFGLSHLNPPYRFLHRADLIALLAEACDGAGVTLNTGAYVRGVSADGIVDAADAPIRADLAVGADGLHSRLREMLNGASPPFFTGQVAWRAVVRHDAPPVAQIWMAPGRHIVTYPLTGGRLNIVAVQERSHWADEGWHHFDDPENLRAAFADMCPALRAILEKVEQTRLWGLFRHPVAQRWHGPGSVILGDAAHPTLPFLAQGANLAIEDAFVLAACCNDADDLPQGLARYQALRRPRVARAIAAANANAVNYHLSGLRRVAAHMALRALGTVAPSAFLRRMDWLYGHDATRAQFESSR
jgi:salicylate hydroxylase